MPETFLIALLAVAGLMVTTWVISLVRRDASIVDIAWGLGFVVVAWATFASGGGYETRALLVTVMVTAWGVRLAGYLAWRNLGKGEDFRYRRMRAQYGARFPIVSLFTVFGLQGVLMLVISLPVQAANSGATPDHLTLLDWLGLAVWLVGVGFEGVADIQLARFKANPANAGAVMDRGLWKYSRHPNYFGDALAWWGVFLVAASNTGSWWVVVSPIVMTILLTRVSGVPLLEKSLVKRRPGYAEYVARTSSFIPRPPRKPRSA